MKQKNPVDHDILNRAKLSIAHGALTNSKRQSCFVEGVYPTHLTHGNGAWVWDTKGNRYLDFICGLGSNLLGYAHTEVSHAIAERAHKGATLSLGTDLEVRCAEKVKEMFPLIERVRFLKTGSDACSAAVRVALAARPRAQYVLSDGYHGWHDSFVSLTPPAVGVPKQAHIYPLSSFGGFGSSVAAVIVEPVITDASPARIEWLKDLRKRCDEANALLIFDEVITGFRYPGYCASKFYGIEPDLICLGKAMGNGMPISVVGGKQDVMECGEYFISSTFAGETLSLAAALKTMTLLQTKYSLEHLWERGGVFLEKFNHLCPDLVHLEGYSTRSRFVGGDLPKALFFQEACKAGILLGPSFFFGFQHIDHADSVLSTFGDILTKIKTGSVALEGKLPASPFAQKVREAS